MIKEIEFRRKKILVLDHSGKSGSEALQSLKEAVEYSKSFKEPYLKLSVCIGTIFNLESLMYLNSKEVLYCERKALKTAVVGLVGFQKNIFNFYKKIVGKGSNIKMFDDILKAKHWLVEED